MILLYIVNLLYAQLIKMLMEIRFLTFIVAVPTVP